MASQPDPVVLRRRLRTELRALRRSTGKTQEQVAKLMDWSTSKLLRIETGEVRAAPSDVRVLALHYEAPEKRVEQLVEMARNARGDSWPDFKDVHQLASLNFFGYEAAASLMRIFSAQLMPGLLQIEEYGRGILKYTFGYDDDEVDRRWEARIRRQELLERDDPPEIFCLLDEGVVRRQVTSPGVTRRQLEHLVEQGQQQHISIRVIPFATGAHPGMTGPFTLLEFPEPQDDDVLYLEHVDGDKVIRDDPSITVKYTERFLALEKIALSEAKTLDLLSEVIAGLGRSATRSTAAPKAEVAR
jgi:transcriptional regulator with XRE-family HTH domain